MIRKLAIEQSPRILQEAHERLLFFFSMPPAVRDQLISEGEPKEADMRVIDELIINIVEDHHEAIENALRPFVDQLLGGNTNFFSEPKKAADFLYFVSIQYFRTVQIREAFISRINYPNVDLRRVWLVLSHIFAVNMGHSLYIDRAAFCLQVLKNDSNVPFITGDQPLVNLLSNPSKGAPPPSEFELYYPLSPRIAVVLTERGRGTRFPERLTQQWVRSLNQAMANHSYVEVYGNSEDALLEVGGSIPSP